MDQTVYETELLAILRQHSDAALVTLRAFDHALPEKARDISIMVHPSQDSDGMFSVMIHLNGPDLYVLNKAIQDCRTLFDVRYVNGRLTPDVPTFDSQDLPFEVNDVIVDTCVIWLQELWRSFGGTTRGLPAFVTGEGGYGSKAGVKLIA